MPYYHVILECSELAGEARTWLATQISEEELQQIDTVTLLNGRNNPNFLKICLDILEQHEYRSQIDLTGALVV